MKGKEFKTITAKKVVLAVLILFSVIAGVTKVLTGFDIDEAYALAIPYRVLQGDRLFEDMWEVHQTSFLIPYLFMKLYRMITGSMDGIVLFTRIVASVIHLVLSLVVYDCLKDFVAVSFPVSAGNEGSDNGKWLAALAALMYYNFLPKWMMNMDFSMLQLWFFTLFLVCLGRAYAFKKREMVRMFAAGLMLAMDVLAYPGMLLVYPAVLVLLCLSKRKEKWRDMLSLTGGCLAAAVIFFACIFRYMSVSELVDAISHIFMDGSHQYDVGTKLGLYAAQWGEVLLQSLILLVPAAFCTWVIKWIYQRVKLEPKYGKLPFGLLFCVIFEILLSVLITFAGLFVTWGPFRLQVRYIIQFVMAFGLWKSLYGRKKGKTEKKRTEEERAEEERTEEERIEEERTEEERTDGKIKVGSRSMGLLFLSLAAFLGILFASNVGPVSSSSYLVIGNLLFVVFTYLAAQKSGRGMKLLVNIGAVLFLCSLIMCKGFYMRNTEYVPGDITNPLAKVEEGPLEGIYVPEDDCVRYTNDYETIQANTTDEDLVLFMGTEGLCNLYANGKIVIPTTISTPAFNEQWVDYFTLYPDKQPTVIFLAKNTVDDRDKFFVKNKFGIWIAKRYDVECMEETDSLCILRPKE